MASDYRDRTYLSVSEVASYTGLSVQQVHNLVKNGQLTSVKSARGPLEETRQMLFSVNLLEDMIQDAVVNFEIDMPLAEKISQTIPNLERTTEYIRNAKRLT